MAQSIFYFVVHINGDIIQRENGASFESNAPLIFRHSRVSTLWELNNLFYPTLVLKAIGRLVHKRLMQDRFMEFCAEVHHLRGSSGFRPFLPQTIPSDDVAMTDYNSADDLDYDDESSCHSTEEDEDVSNIPSLGGPRLLLPASLPIANISEVRSFFQELDLDTRHVEDPSMECVADEYNTDGGVEFRVGHRMQNRQAVLMSVKNYSIRRNAEYKVIESDRLKYHCRCKHHTAGRPWMIRIALRQNLGYWYARLICLS
ncbi:hypothetical protein PIB30_077493 [Stylosanthes scabra]|uniref:Transposase MuDR plant domain-containing protein n=1 Tax=Stylosanthes scabra TaxID=79078 RepID=A0ABU6XRI3_9FABA|nr:hypothetical protein [Stylosanthes scabra]